ncbi:MAG TPA: transglutaminase-like cysteine peptidase [Stellaceae bacterium]|nr:transglutaminase-like cysteine peptidase [Stellaceae bacterium]
MVGKNIRSKHILGKHLLSKHLRGLLVSLALVVSTLAPAAAEGLQVAYAPAALPPPARGAEGLFGTAEYFSSDITPFYKWTEALSRSQTEIASALGPCPVGATEACAPRPWVALLATLQGLDLRAKAVRVNAEINRYPYVPSQVNWGTANHWETPFEFFRRSGQCQDYAIAKFMALRAAGVPNELMRIVVVRDLAQAVDHAVLAVYVDGEALVLDNQTDAILPASEIVRYRPYYSINEAGWWRHMPRRSDFVADAGRSRAPR